MTPVRWAGETRRPVLTGGRILAKDGVPLWVKRHVRLCTCMREVRLEDLRWWDHVGAWLGTCPACKSSVTIHPSDRPGD